MINKILTVLTSIFGWLFNLSNQRRTNRREDEQYHREAMAELRHSNDELIVRLTELYKEVVESKKEIAQLNLKIVKLTTENEKLSAQITQLSNELKKPKRPAKAANK